MWIVAIINIYNFLDGIDGYSGSQGAIAGAGLLLFFWGGPLGIIGGIVLAACLAFLVFNWHPSKVFMGDGGATALGFLFAVLPFYAERESSTNIGFFILIALWFFIMDGAAVILVRLLRRQKIWEAHRMHLYQKLVRVGWKHDQVTLLLIVLMVLLFGTVYIGSSYFTSFRNWLSLSTALTLLALYYAYVWLKVKKFTGKAKS